MKILMIAPTPFFADRGGHVRIYEEMRILKKMGHEVTVVTYHLGNSVPGFVVQRTPNIPWIRELGVGPNYHKLYLDILLLIKTVQLLLTKKFDIIHAHLHEGALIAGVARILSIKNIPIVFDYQGSLVEEMLDHGYLKKRFVLQPFKWVERIAECFPEMIIPSSPSAVLLLKKERRKRNVVPFTDAVDTSLFRPFPESEKLRKRLRIPKGKIIVVYLGVLSDYQGVDLLVKAIPEVVRKYPNVHFLIMGHPNVERYQEMAGREGIGQYVTFTGKVEYALAPQYLCLGNIAVSFKKSQTEANGKVLNYMACGLPCVVSDTKVNRELLSELGVYTKLEPRDIARKMIALLMGKKKQKLLAKRVRKRAVKGFSYETNGRKLVYLYQMLLKEVKNIRDIK